MDCRYDGSYAGLLTLLYRLFSRRGEPTAISVEPPAHNDLFAAVFDCATDPALATRLSLAIDEHLGAESGRNIRCAFLGELPGVEMAIYAYLKLGWRLRRDLDQHLGNVVVADIHRRARRTLHEGHRLKGLLRFRETEGGFFYASVRSDTNVLAILASHFARRLSDHPWLIHDVRRDLGALFDGKRWVVGQLQLESTPTLSAEEHQWQSLWRTFFDRIAIPGRINPACRKASCR